MAGTGVTIEGFRLSPQQRRLWSLCAHAPEHLAAYRARGLVRIRGPLDAARWEQALAAVAKSYEIFRTSLVKLPEMELPLQAIGTQLPRLEHIEPADRETASLDALVEALREQPGDPDTPLGRLPLWRFALASFKANQHALLVDGPALLADGPTLVQLVHELAGAYAGSESDAEREEPLQYADLAQWQNELFESEEGRMGLTSWRSQNMPLPEPLPWPLVNDAGGSRPFAPRRCTLTLNTKTVQGLRSLAERYKVSLPSLLLAGWMLLVTRHTGRQETIGLVCDGRPYEELADALGPLSRYVPLRTGYEKALSLRCFTEGVYSAAATAGRWQESFCWSKLIPESSQPPHFAISFAFDKQPAATQASDLLLELTEQQVHYDREQLGLKCLEGAATGELMLEVHYDSQQLSRRQAEQWLFRQERLLQSMLKAPEATVGELQMLTAADRRELLFDLAGRGADDGADADVCLHELIERHAAERPEATAVVCGDERLSYGELDRRAEHLAAELRQLGVAAESIAGILLDRSADFVVAILGIWKAGGAFLPLDPSLPASAIRYRMTHAGICALITGAGMGHDPGDEMPTVVLDAQAESASERTIAPADAQRRRRTGTAPNGAYVLYTSGSTGKPKAVCVEHRQLASYVAAAIEVLRLAECASFATLSTFAADLGNTCVFPALVLGKTLHIVPSACVADPAALVQYFVRAPVDVLKIVPSHLAALLAANDPRALLPRQRLILGGEALRWDLAEQLQQLAPACRIFNHYGPTETTVGVAAGEVDDAADRRAATVPLGKPLPGCRILLLDEHRQLVPRGAAGEICVGGTQVARGYLHAPRDTAAKFIPDPFQDAADERLYCTGDRARWLPDGTLEFLGRIDQQVKIRGFRVELGEIESLLQEHEGLEQAAVVFRGEAPGRDLLIGYYTGTADIEAVRRRLSEHLPEYMVPSQLIALPELPRTANGKIDRQTLRSRNPSLESRGEYLAPRTETERLVAQVFADTLGIERVGLDGHFFELGGHSLLATSALLRLRQACAVELPLQVLFDDPTVAGVARSIEAALRRGEARPPELRRADRQQPLPLSFAQQRLWLLDRLEPELNAAYTIPVAARLTGALDVTALQWAIGEICRRHEAWRTTIANRDDNPVQLVHCPREVPLPLVDLTCVPAEAQEQEVREQLAGFAALPFDLERGPLIRVLLVRLATAEHVVLFTCHHLVFDAWSQGVLVRELVALYEAGQAGRPSPLAELEFQYADYAAWQRSWLAGEPLQLQLDYWREQLADLPGPLELATDRPRPAVQTFRGAKYAVSLPAELSDRLADLSRRQQATLFMTLLSGFKALLFRYTGQTDLPIGTPIAGRSRPEFEPLLGFFTNTLVLRSRFHPGITFAELIGHVRSTALAAYSHQDLPFEQLVEAVAVDRSLSHTPLFQVMFTLRNTPRAAIELPGLTLQPLPLDNRSAKFDLTLLLEETPGGLQGFIEYNTDLLDESTIARMAEHYRQLLAAAADQPDLPVAELPLLSPAERQRLFELGEGRRQRAAPLVLDLFARQATRRTDDVAVVFEQQQMTYGELNRHAERIARRLQALGVGPDVLVGIFLERSIEMVAALLGVLKAGGAYVPLDPSLPAQRIGSMLADAQAAVLITHSSLADRVPPQEGSVVCIDRIGAESEQSTAVLASGPESGPVTLPAAEPAEQSAAAALDANNLAYVIYTSGSTGKPKGVQISHGALANFLQAMHRRLSVGRNDVLPAVTTLSFDIAALEIFLPLTVGAKLEVVSRDVAIDGPRLAEKLRTSSATMLQATPATWQMLIAAGWAGGRAFKALCGGEAMPLPLAEALTARCGEVWNLYGPTETTIWSSAALLEDAPGHISLGQPIDNTRLLILDAHGQLAAQGVIGELAIGGSGLARGYLGRPDLTAERFVPDPFDTVGGGRLYRTGDLVRYRSDAALEYVGRADQQVKLRGYRIEPGEIESALLDQDHVAQAAVVLHRAGREDAALAAYVVVAEGGQPTVESLRRGLQQALPEYMVPPQIVILPQMPLSSSGKIDRSALPEPRAAAASHDRQSPDLSLATPRTPTEKMLAELLAEFLPVDTVGVHESFFQLGGNSLIAVQVISRLRQRVRRDVPLRMLFTAPTVAGLAAAIDEAATQAAEQSASALPPLTRQERSGPLPLSFAQQRVWLDEQLHPGTGNYNIPAAVRLRGELDEQALQAALDQLVARHESLRTVFPAEEGKPRQVVLPARPFRWEVVDLSHLSEVQQEAQQQVLMQEQARRPFQLVQGPLVRLMVIKRGAQHHVALLAMHHIVSDLWSLGVMLRELAALYQAFHAGAPSPLPEPELQYADFAIAQRRWLSEQSLAEQLTYWESRLSGAPRDMLPVDTETAAGAADQSNEMTFAIDLQTTAELKALGNRFQASLYMTLLAGLKVLLVRHSRQPDIVVGTDYAGRDRAELEGLIGFFVNLLVLRTDLSGNPSFPEVLARVRETCLEAFAHAELPFSKLLEELPVDRTGHSNPLFQFLFVYQNVPLEPVELPGFSFEPLPMSNSTAKFDIALFVNESPQGLRGTWRFQENLFHRSTVRQLSDQFAALLRAIARGADRPIDQLETISPTQREAEAMQARNRAERKFQKFKQVQPQAVKLDRAALVKTSWLGEQGGMPLVVEPCSEDVDLIEWAAGERDWIGERLERHGAILFRGGPFSDTGSFEQFAAAVCGSLYSDYGDLPRAGMGGRIYASTPYPPDRPILMHNESSHLNCWPLRILFFCQQPAEQGGETPIADCRKVYRAIPASLRQALREKQLMYVRNFVPGFDVRWQDFFQTEDKAEVEARCRQAGITCEWTAGEVLRTRQVRQAVAIHPRTGEAVWFNQLPLHHVAALPAEVRASLLASLSEDHLPRHVYYGDGSPISDEEVSAILAAYDQAAVTFPWRQGDVLLVDNMLTAHSRNPYQGERSIQVAMGEMMTADQSQSGSA